MDWVMVLAECKDLEIVQDVGKEGGIIPSFKFVV